MKHYIFIAVDYQVGFCEGGNLAVNGGKKAVAAASELLNHKVALNDNQAESENLIKEVIFTKDAHPATHSSFKDFNPEGLWPVHCVEHTVDGAIMDPLIYDCAKNGIPYGVVGKGQNIDEENYTAFRFVYKNQDLYTYSLAPNFDPTKNTLDFIQDPDDKEEYYNELVIGGIAGDYCVLETIKAFIDMDPIVYLPGIASIDGGKALNDYIKEHDLRIMDESFNIISSIEYLNTLK